MAKEYTPTLKQAREGRGYTQAEAAKLIGISVETLGNYERGKSYPYNSSIFLSVGISG